MKVNLNKCKKGDVLISVHGKAFIYDGKIVGHNFPHQITDALNTKLLHSRTDDGQVFRNNKLPADHDIVKIIHIKQHS